MRYIFRTFAIFFLFSTALFYSTSSWGASASISVSPQADGGVHSTVTGSFASCTVCDAFDANGVCISSHTNNSGSVSLSRDGGFLCSASGNSSATCTVIEDRGGLHGTHIYNGSASDCTGSGASSFTLTLDNTPTVAVTGPTGVVSAPFDVTGTATFKPTLNPTKGTIAGFINGGHIGTKFCSTENCAFSYKELTGQLFTLAPGGPYTVRLTAQGGGASATSEKTFTVATCRDNDGDGYFAFDAATCPQGNDCNDNDPAINPAATEKCNGKDENCNGEIDEDACQCSVNVALLSSLNLSSGNLTHSQDLFSTRGTGLTTSLSLNYNSLDTYSGPLGIGWVHSYDIALREMSDGSVIFREGDGKRRLYKPSGGGYVAQPGNYSTLAKEAGGWTLVEKSGATYHFNVEGKITSISDRNGNVKTFAYAGSDLATIVDSAGRITAFHYDATHRISAITDPNGNSHTFTYSNDTLTAISTQDLLLGARSWSYTYDAAGFLLSKTDPNGNTTTYAYDAEHRVVAATSPEGKVKTITYSPTTTTTMLTESDGGVWSYRYDTTLGVLTQKADPQGNTTVYTYDENKNLVLRKDPDGSTTSYTFDSLGNITSTTDALGQTTTYTYNPFGQISSTTGPQGDVTVQAYDPEGNLISTTDPSGALTRYEYDAAGNVTKVTNDLGQITTFTYDLQGNLASITDPAGATTTFTYDISGNMTSQTDGQGNTTRFEYNSLNQLIKVIDPSGKATVYTYDLNGNRASQTDANGNPTDYEYNSKGQLTAVRDALGHITAYAYSETGCPSCGGGGDKLTSVTDAKGQTTHYHYDHLGRLVEETDPVGNSPSYTYDAKGNLTSRTDANGATTQYVYDPLGRLLNKSYPDSTTEVFTYDPKGNILTASNQHIAYAFSYDINSRVTAVTDSNGRAVSYQYDALGNRTKTTYPDGSVVSYSYDKAGRLVSIAHGGRTFAYQYDSLGRRIKTTLPNGTHATYTYDSNGRLTNLTHRTSTGSILQSFAYTHDNVGNRLSKTEVDTKHTYSYDKIYRLLESLPTKLKGKDKEEEHKAEAFSYDPVGNRLRGPRTKDFYSYNLGNQLTSNGKHQYHYDGDGNLIQKTEIDDDGETKTWSYFYDFENRLIKVVKQEKDEVKTITFRYDPFGRRIEKKVEETEEGKTEIKTYAYVYDNEDIILEFLTKAEGGKTKTETTRYLHGPGIDEALAIERKSEVYFYHADGLGSITALTDSKQKIVESYTYSSFGEVKRKGDKVKNVYTFTGREWDKEIGLIAYYFDSGSMSS